MILKRRLYTIVFIFTLFAGWGQNFYWETPEILMSGRARFPVVDARGDRFSVLWQDFETVDEDTGRIYLSLGVFERSKWNYYRKIAGPIFYRGSESPIANLVMTERGVLIPYLKEEQLIGILYKENGSGEFTEVAQIPTPDAALSPRIFQASDGYYLLFSQSLETNISIFYSHSTDGTEWSEIRHILGADENLKLNFSPNGLTYKNVEYMVFQSQLIDDRGIASYQIYLKKSLDGGRTWQPGILVSDFEESVDSGTFFPGRFDNQRPQLYTDGNELYLVWERRLIGRSSQIYYATLDEETGEVEFWDQVSNSIYNCYSPTMFKYKDNLGILWFDNQKGDFHIKLAEKGDFTWEERDISLMLGSSAFPRVVTDQKRIFLFWENTLGDDVRLVQLGPDRSVPTPRIIPGNFRADSASRQDFYTVLWDIAKDSSGIEGYNFIWSQDFAEEVPETLKYLASMKRGRFQAIQDGEWYFHIKARDYAGNWSEQRTVSVTRDTTPPGMVQFSAMDTDRLGFFKSNSVVLEWEPRESVEDLQGFSYRLVYLGDKDALLDWENKPALAGSNVQLQNPQVSFDNIDNGLYAFSVRAIDSVGNVGAPSITTFRLNKYIPVTYISYVDTVTDALGKVTMNLFGRGFSEGGRINQVIIDSDGIAPYDYIFTLNQGAYRVASDRQIQGLTLEDIEEGRYRIGVNHPSRGLFFSKPILEADVTGTVKFGDYGTLFSHELKPILSTRPAADTGILLYIFITVFLAMLIVMSIRQLYMIFNEERRLQVEMRALVSGKAAITYEEKARIKEMKSKGFGLRVKFAFSILILVFGVLLAVSITLGWFITEKQQESLAEGLLKQTEVLLSSLAKSSETYLPTQNELELALIPNQISAMDDAVIAFIAGPGRDDSRGFSYIWGVSDPNDEYFLERLSTPEWTQGLSEYSDNTMDALKALEEDINQKANEKLVDVRKESERVSRESQRLALRTDRESIRIKEELFAESRRLNDLEREVLEDLGRVTGSYPEFNPEDLDLTVDAYLFYKPVIYSVRGESRYFRGVVRVLVSTQSILHEIEDSQKNLFMITGFIALGALALGLVGALFLASITVNPIKKLVAGVAVIRDTEDKSELKDHKIEVKTKDELALLADTINQMTTGLVKAAVAQKDLTVGKEVQKMFIPLDTDSSGRKMTTGQSENQYMEFFGYYEGAKGVSGDYFDFTKLSEELFAFIKCDVAGKGVPASLIMVEVATLYLNYIKDFKIGSKIDLEPVVYRINDLLEERGFKGRFAAFNMGIMNVKTGEIWFCNAGDNIVHGFDATKGKSFQKELPKAPAAGVFPSMLLEMKGGFTQIKDKFNSGDMYFLFTDGVEEAKRNFRDSELKPTVCKHPGLKDGDMHGSHPYLSGDEEFSLERIHDIVDALMNRGTYQLIKYHDPLNEDNLIFDFSTCEGTIKDVVLAFVAVEKVFRLFPDPSSTAEDKIKIDTKIDDFLKEHFLAYDEYFSHPAGESDLVEYRYYSHMKEDEQYDDLTILGVKKK